MTQYEYDVIVIGGGHAGCEAAAAAATLGSKTLLVSMDMTKFAQMSCNPAIGGIAKGQIVREIDALGGHTAIVTDRTSIQFRMLNRSKGPAMWSPRSQCDRTLFSIEWRKILESIPKLYFWQDTVTKLIIRNHVIEGIHTALGVQFTAKAVILTAGTFLDGKIHVGQAQTIGGRVGELSSHGLTQQLIDLGFETGRMKTGTPARLDGRSINFDLMQEQAGDDIVENELLRFSFLPKTQANLPQRSCFITHTTSEVHETLRQGFHESPLFSGIIKGIGPRYCPSIEDKIRTFLDKEQHHLFIEPEGVDSCEYYINGFSSSLPLSIQLEALRKVPGLENSYIFRPGYAIEYDFFQPTQLEHTLETKYVKGLFFAGQINGTTGYEEAASQGLIAGINAHQTIHQKEALILHRDQAYIGVLIDDLVTKGVDEPYRMFTSRAEYRLLLRQDNADARLTPIGYNLGLASKTRYQRCISKQEYISNLCTFIKNESIPKEQANIFLTSINSKPLTQARRILDVVLRPEVALQALALAITSIQHQIAAIPDGIRQEVVEAADIFIKYEGYISRERIAAEKQRRLENISIPAHLDYSRLISLSMESRQKLSKHRPKTIGQASRIPGVSPADISILLVFLGR